MAAPRHTPVADPPTDAERERAVRFFGRILDRRGEVVVGASRPQRWESWRLRTVIVPALLDDLNATGRKVEAEVVDDGRYVLRAWETHPAGGST